MADEIADPVGGRLCCNFECSSVLRSFVATRNSDQLDFLVVSLRNVPSNTYDPNAH